jgi:mono/diheme cytochrome c family protein
LENVLKVVTLPAKIACFLTKFLHINIMIYRNLLHYLTLAIVCFGFFASEAHAADPKKGMTLFNGKCASCHSGAGKLTVDGSGPALNGAEARWKEAGGDIYAWISNSTSVVLSGEPYAVALFNKWNKVTMTAFPELKKEDIDDILAYIDNKSKYGAVDEATAMAANGGGGAAAGGAAAGPKKEEGPNYTLWILFAVLLGAVATLGRYVHNLNRLAQQRTGESVDAPKSMMAIVFNPSVVKFIIFGLIILGGYTTVNNAIGLSRQQNYAPDQPIKFSHILHAGKHKIDCQYCHDGARRSKHGSIPAVNTCMNCHTVVAKGPQYGTAEIIKIYAAASFNPAAKGGRTYFTAADADSVRLKAYAEWLETANAEDLEKAETKVKTEKSIANQLESIKTLMGKPIEWIRIHNLPDHAYFNHSQHVVAGGQACQTCHGKVEEMEVVKQYSPLSMGWCVNCHRQTEVKFGENPYYGPDSAMNKTTGKMERVDTSGYSSYEVYHKQIRDGKRKGVTVEDIGGLECQKCHY